MIQPSGLVRNALCGRVSMSTDEHYNEPGKLPEPLEDDQPNDMPATQGIFIALVVVAFIALIALALLQVKW